MRRILRLAVAIAVSTGVVATTRSGRAAEAPGELDAPILSVRRVPSLLTGFVAERRLRTVLDRALADPAVRSVVPTSCLDVRAGGRVLYSRQNDREVTPASTLKVLTATAALAVLGPDTTLPTIIRADNPVKDGVVTGDLQVVGGGDPLISTSAFAAEPPRPLERWTRMEAIADAIVAAGIKRVSGGVRGDESRYDTERTRPGWRASYVADGHVGPLGALMVNDGQGDNAEAVSNPALHFGSVLTGLLRQRGVDITGQPAVGKSTGTTEITRIESLPVRELVSELLALSDNVTAELLTKEMGVRAGGAGTTEAGLAAAEKALTDIGIDLAGVEDQDGSGLHRDDRVTCRALVSVLQHAGRDSIVAKSLPIAGRTGTLDDRLVGTPAEGRVQAKTGSLDGVNALAGWVDPREGRAAAGPLAFAVVANGAPRGEAATAFPDKVALALASWPDAPDPATLEPEARRR